MTDNPLDTFTDAELVAELTRRSEACIVALKKNDRPTTGAVIWWAEGDRDGVISATVQALHGILHDSEPAA